jgi:hypothetical protein
MREQKDKQQGDGEHNKGYSIIEGAIRQTLDLPINGCKEETEVDHALALAWMWDTQDVVSPLHPHQQKQFPSPVANNNPCTDIQ